MLRTIETEFQSIMTHWPGYQEIIKLGHIFSFSLSNTGGQFYSSILNKTAELLNDPIKHWVAKGPQVLRCKIESLPVAPTFPLTP